MGTDVTIEATPGQVAAIERDGFLAVVGPTRVCPCVPMDSDGCDGCPGVHPVPTTKPCGLCCGQGHVLKFKGGGALTRCRTCNGDGTVPITVEVVVPERECGLCGGASCIPFESYEAVEDATEDCPECTDGTLSARTLLRGTAEAVPVVEDCDDVPDTPSLVEVLGPKPIRYWMAGMVDTEDAIDITHHFADVPRPEVGDTAWMVKP